MPQEMPLEEEPEDLAGEGMLDSIGATGGIARAVAAEIRPKKRVDFMVMVW